MKKLALLLAVVMVVCSFGAVTVFADMAGTGTEGDPYLITSVDDFKLMTSGSKYYKLTCDLDFTGVTWTPYEAKAHLDGDGHKILNLVLDTSGDNKGIFTKVTNGSVRNLIVDESCSFTSSSKTVGAITGIVISGSVIENCVNYANVTGSSNNTGGIAGTVNSGGTINNCTNYGTINGTNYNGGIVGTSNGVVTNCKNYGTVDSSVGSRYLVGGIAGSYAAGSMSDCENYGLVTANKGVGGIAGSISSNLTLGSCKNYGEIHCSYRSVGGIVGNNNYATIENCVNYGTVCADNDYAGGITGAASEKAYAPSNSIHVINCENAGYVYSPGTHVAGISPKIVGTADAPSIIEGCKNTGVVHQATRVEAEDGTVSYTLSTTEAGGGIVGRILGCCIIKDCYNVADNAYAAGIVGRCANEKIDKTTRTLDNTKIINCYSIGACADPVALSLNTDGTVEIANVYYLEGTETIATTATAVTEAQVASGEVAWMLNKNHQKTVSTTTESTEIVDEVETVVTTTTITLAPEAAYVWSQKTYPILADADNNPVYKCTVNYTDGADAVYYMPKATENIDIYVSQYVSDALSKVKSQKNTAFADELTIDAGFAKAPGNTLVMFWNGITPLCEKVEK